MNEKSEPPITREAMDAAGRVVFSDEIYDAMLSTRSLSSVQRWTAAGIACFLNDAKGPHVEVLRRGLIIIGDGGSIS